MRKEFYYLAAFALIAFAVYHRIKSATAAVDDAIDEATKPVGEALHNLEQWVRGNEGVKATRSGFILDERYVGADYKITQWWRMAISEMHPDNAALFRKITDRAGRLLPKYRYLIEQLVSPTTI